MIRVVLVLALGACLCNAQMQKLCTCAQVEPCKNNAVGSVIPCADKCQKHAANAGTNYNVMRGCVMQYRPQIEATLNCVMNSFKGTCSPGPTNRMVPKRYAAGIEIAIMSEINGMIASNGISAQVARYVGAGRKYASCMQKCIEKQTSECARRANCGLDLPSDTVIAQTIKNCAVNSGLLNTQVVRSLCQCAVRAGAGYDFYILLVFHLFTLNANMIE
ncbi:unnamed protein product [Toxocara canis]|uniref:Uncharacterized protein n=1 Tax=Toxocara canis TaxID=6265 RepID=A0A183UKN0_TOXCA|nr:unnamed protein product [Toxocara canis]